MTGMVSTDMPSDELYNHLIETKNVYPLPDLLYPGSKDWLAADYAGRVEWLHAMYESRKDELDNFLTMQEEYSVEHIPDTVKYALQQARHISEEALRNGIDNVSDEAIKSLITALESVDPTLYTIEK